MRYLWLSGFIRVQNNWCPHGVKGAKVSNIRGKTPQGMGYAAYLKETSAIGPDAQNHPLPYKAHILDRTGRSIPVSMN
jgi:hypothetical protein